MTVIRHMFLVVAVCGLLCCGQEATAQETSDAAAMAAMLREIAAEAARVVGGRGVFLDVRPENAPVAVWQVYSEELQKAGASVYTEPTDGASMLAVDVRVMYSSAVSVGDSSYFRKLNLTAGTMLESVDGSAIEWSKEFVLAREDTLRGSPSTAERDFLEEGGGSWGESWLTPVIVTAMALVLVVLLFTVRGS